MCFGLKEYIQSNWTKLSLAWWDDNGDNNGNDDDNDDEGGDVDNDNGRGCGGDDVDDEENDNIQVPYLPALDYDNDHHDTLIKVM